MKQNRGLLFFAVVSLVYWLTACGMMEDGKPKTANFGLIATPASYYSTPKARYLGDKYKANLDRLVDRVVRNPKTANLQFANNIASVGGIGFFTHSAATTADARYLELILAAPETFETTGDYSAKLSRLFSSYGPELLSMLASDPEIYNEKDVTGYGLNFSWRKVGRESETPRVGLERAVAYFDKQNVRSFLKHDLNENDLLKTAVIFAMEEDGPMNLVSFRPPEPKADFRPPIQEETLESGLSDRRPERERAAEIAKKAEGPRVNSSPRGTVEPAKIEPTPANEIEFREPAITEKKPKSPEPQAVAEQITPKPISRGSEESLPLDPVPAEALSIAKKTENANGPTPTPMSATPAARDSASPDNQPQAVNRKQQTSDETTNILDSARAPTESSMVLPNARTIANTPANADGSKNPQVGMISPKPGTPVAPAKPQVQENTTHQLAPARQQKFQEKVTERPPPHDQVEPTHDQIEPPQDQVQLFHDRVERSDDPVESLRTEPRVEAAKPEQPKQTGTTGSVDETKTGKALVPAPGPKGSISATEPVRARSDRPTDPVPTQKREPVEAVSNPPREATSVMLSDTPPPARGTIEEKKENDSKLPPPKPPRLTASKNVIAGNPAESARPATPEGTTELSAAPVGSDQHAPNVVPQPKEKISERVPGARDAGKTEAATTSEAMTRPEDRKREAVTVIARSEVKTTAEAEKPEVKIPAQRQAEQRASVLTTPASATAAKESNSVPPVVPELTRDPIVEKSQTVKPTVEARPPVTAKDRETSNSTVAPSVIEKVNEQPTRPTQSIQDVAPVLNSPRVTNVPRAVPPEDSIKPQPKIVEQPTSVERSTNLPERNSPPAVLSSGRVTSDSAIPEPKAQAPRESGAPQLAAQKLPPEQIALLTKKPPEVPVEKPAIRGAVKALEGYIIQLSFHDRAEAQRWAEKLNARGFAVSATESGAGGFRVRMGNFAVRSDAERQLKLLNQDGLKGIVVNLPQAYRPEVHSSADEAAHPAATVP